ncbi:acyltransferase family protein [Alteromonas sp. PRIM-21]|uniref:acyltransferase family protein n=1 Tax=Alteromonas sp. PRIM-21 TaxID=1454978 RepID=UPI0022B9A053|nr:acyltransferase [Alteromonas sp. PRIM-21]MCZ8528422.1 acyltransferase [Alteromonas sp. PRIM-21]
MRDIRIDTLRGLACIFLVGYHVIGNNPSNGLHIESGFLREINDLLETVRMPLFTFLSGMVYAYRPLSENWPKFLKGKARRLLTPMLVVGTLFALIQALVPGTNNKIDNWWLLHIYPVQHFWFVEALFWVFILIIPLELNRLLNSRLVTVLIIAAFLALAVGQPYTKLLAFKGFIYLTPFFLFGMSIVRFKISPLPILPSLLSFVGIMAAIYFLTDGVYGRSLMGCVIGMLSCYFLLGLKLRVTLLARIGIYSYSIYIFHVFFTAATRIIANKLFSVPDEINFVIGLLFGIMGPIAVYLVAKQYPLGQLLFLGESQKK